MTTIGFVGLGNMGAPMAANLVKSGEHVLGFDVVEASRETSARDGVQIVATARSTVESADVVITMLPAGAHVLSVWDDIVPLARQGTLFIDCSTIDVASARKAHVLAAARGIATLDAPVSGGVGGAKAATLTFMVGGSEHAFAHGKPILERMGKRVVHCGEAGNGQVAKICNNMILGASMIAVSEAFVLGEKLGLSHQAMFDVVSASSGQCWSLTSYCPVPGPVPASPANNGYKAGFAAALMLKDLKLAHEAAHSVHAATALGAHAAEIYDAFAAEGHGAADFSAIINLVRERSKHG
ncbi:MAG: 3-hydroxyisobutyrate dehydrogenase [Xanthobacteraceae bacterium]|jgi:3-hydroxyisobutyrate dehydrogenase